MHIDEDSEDLSRSEVILKGALAAGAVYGALAVGPFVGRALAMSEGGDVGILNFALTLEYLESAFYEEAKKRAKASGELKSLIDLLGRRRARARRSADRNDQAARRQAGGGTEVRLPLQRHRRLPEARPDLRGHRGQRLQRRRAVDQGRRKCSPRPARSSRSRPVTPRRSGCRTKRNRRRKPSTRARRSEGAEGCGTLHRVAEPAETVLGAIEDAREKAERLADEELMPLIGGEGPRRLRGLLRPPRRRRLLARLQDRRRAGGGRRRHPGGLHLDLAQRRPLRPRRAAASAPGCWAIVRNRAIDVLRSKTGRAPKLDFDDDSILEQRPAAELTEDEALRARDRRRRCAARSASCPASSRR